MPDSLRQAQRAASSDTAVTAVLTLAVAAVGSNSLLLSPLLADVADALETTLDTVARSMAAYGAATAVSALTLAKRIDRYGAVPTMRIGLALVLAGVVGSATAPSWVVLSLAQALSGVGAGMVLPACYAAATAYDRDGGRMLSRVLTGWSISLVAGVPLAALIAEATTWRMSYGPLAALLVLACWGAATLDRTNFRDGASRQDDNAGAGIGAASVLRIPGVIPLLLACLCFMTAFYGIYAFVGSEAVRRLGVGTGTAGLIAMAYGIGFAVPPFAPRMLGARLATLRLSGCFALLGLCYLSLTLPFDLAGLLAIASCWGFAQHLAQNRQLADLSCVSPDARGTLLGINSSVMYLGSVVGAGGFGLVHARFGFAPLPVLAAASALLAMFLGHRTKGTPDDSSGSVGTRTSG